MAYQRIKDISAVRKVTDDGDGSTFLTNDGTYKVAGGGGEQTASFTVATGKSVTAGRPVVLTSAGAEDAYLEENCGDFEILNKYFAPDNSDYTIPAGSSLAAVALNDETCLLFYGRYSNIWTHGMRKKPGDLNPIVLASTTWSRDATVYNASMSRVSDTRAICSYRSNGIWYATIVTANAASTSFGAQTQVYSGDVSSGCVVGLSATKAAFCYVLNNEASGQVFVKILTLSGATITAVGSANTCVVSAGRGPGVECNNANIRITDSLFVVSWYDVSDQVYRYLTAFSVSGDTVTCGTAKVMTSVVVSSDCAGVRISDTRAIFFSRADASSGYRLVYDLVDFSGTTITETTVTYQMPIADLNNPAQSDAVGRKPFGSFLGGGFYLFSFHDLTNGGIFHTSANIIGNTINVHNIHEFSGTKNYFTGHIAHYEKGAHTAFFLYQNGDTSYRTWVSAKRNIFKNPNNLIGIAKTSGSAGQSVTVSYGPVVAGLSGLTAGSKYFLQFDGTLGTTPVYDRGIGVAISTTELRLVL